MDEQHTPASVDLMIVRRLAEGLRRKAVEYRKGDKPQRAEGCDEDADALERVAALIERLSAEREGLLTLLSLARPFVADDTEATCDIADRIDAAISKATGDA